MSTTRTRRRRTAALATAMLGGLTGARAAVASPPDSTYKLIFADEFNGTALDAMKWNYNYPWSQHGLADDSVEQASQVSVANGALSFTATNAGQTYGGTHYNYTSGAINSSGKLNFTYGYVEASQRMPAQAGTWGATWMLQSGWPPEIDVMETPAFTAHSSNYSSGYHYTTTSNTNGSAGPGIQNERVDLSAAYHTYGMDWEPTYLKFYFDGKQVGSTITDATAIAQAAGEYLLLDLGIGGWPGEPAAGTITAAAPAVMQTDWVHVYQVPASTGVTTYNHSGPGSWDTAANWTASVPKYQDVVAKFATNATTATASAISWTNSRTVGGLQFDSTTPYSIGDSTGGLQLANSSGTAAITMSAATTAAQSIGARLELYSNVTVTNSSTQTLSLLGQVIGTGSLSFFGAGTTLVSNNNTYTGNTYIGSSQGPAVVRADRSQPFGLTGTVAFDPAGNASTARLEVLANRTIPNNITLAGRNNASVAIENISGANGLLGTVTSIGGGGSYTIQSDAGTLTLSASSTTTGVALTTAASGNRTFTLQGAGNGVVAGAVTNGTGIVGLTKAGTGTWTLSGANSYTGPTAVNGGTLAVAAPGALPANDAVTVAAGALLATAAHGASPTILLQLSGLSLAGSAGAWTGEVDLNDNAAVIHNGVLATVASQAAQGFAGGSWNASGGLTSTAAANDASHRTAVGVIANVAANGVTPLFASFDGQPVSASDVLAMYTEYGDTNLDGTVTAADYTRVDAGYVQGLTGWANGDFNYDGVVDGSDYTLMDNAFNQQSSSYAPVASATAVAAAEVASVPEPGVTGLIGVAALVSLAKRRRPAIRE